MRKQYVKPVGNVVALQMDENIALSLGFMDLIVEFTLSYQFRDGIKYIKETSVKSLNQSSELVGSTLDLLILADAIVDGIEKIGPVVNGWENCNSNPAVSTSTFRLN